MCCQVSGLSPGINYRLRVEAVVKDCGEKEDCRAFSRPHLHSLPCPPGGCHQDQEDPEEDCDGWQCHSGFCIAATQRCDGVVHCSDSSDEAGCPGCPAGQFRCVRDGRCVETARVCDRQLDCWDGSDETNCAYRQRLCWPGGFLCLDGECVGLAGRCDGVWDCSHGEDEQQCGAACGLDQWRCRDGTCIERAELCNNVTDCEDRSDEWPHCHCHTTGLASCPQSGQCLPSHSFCDGQEDCEDGSDELNCHNKLARTASYQMVEKVTSPSPADNSESYEKYPDFPLELLPSYKDKFLGFKALSLTKNTKKPSKSAASQTKEREGKDVKFSSNEVEPAGAGVLVKVYPAHQTVMEGQDVVVQCRDEGELRTPVTWHRGHRGQQLPVNSSQERGRLELYGVREEDGGEYTCSSVLKAAAPGGSQTSSIDVVKPHTVP